MAHYDCSNCGAYLGIAWGSCTKCTPKEWDELKKEKSDLIQQFKNQWDRDNKKLLDMLEEWKKKIEEARTNFAKEQSAARLKEIEAEMFVLEYKHHYSFGLDRKNDIIKRAMALWNVSYEHANQWFKIPSVDLCFGRSPEEFCSTKGGFEHLKKLLEKQLEEKGIFAV